MIIKNVGQTSFIMSTIYIIINAPAFANPSDTTSIIMENEAVQRSIPDSRTPNPAGNSLSDPSAVPPVARPFNPPGVNPPNPSGFNSTSPSSLVSPNPSAFNPSSPQGTNP